MRFGVENALGHVDLCTCKKLLFLSNENLDAHSGGPPLYFNVYSTFLNIYYKSKRKSKFLESVRDVLSVGTI